MLIRTKLRELVAEVKNLDIAMTELRKVTQLTEEQYVSFQQNAIGMAKDIGASVTDIINSTADFARLGYSADAAQELAQAAIVYKNVADGIDDIDTATESITSTLKAFGDETYSAMQIVDMFNEVGNRFAINSGGIGEALVRSASALRAGGNTLEEGIALITAANTVMQNPQAVGTGIKTLTMYLRAAKSELEEAGESAEGCYTSVSKLRNEMLGLTGVDITLDAHTFKSTTQILRELSQVWDEMDDITQARVTEMIAGKRNANLVQAIMKNFKDAEEVIQVASNEAEGSALEANEKYLNSIEGHIARLKASFTELAQNVLSTDSVKAFYDSLNGVLGLLNGMSNIFGGLPTIIAVLTMAFKMLGKDIGIAAYSSEAGWTFLGLKLKEINLRALAAAAGMKALHAASHIAVTNSLIACPKSAGASLSSLATASSSSKDANSSLYLYKA